MAGMTQIALRMDDDVAAAIDKRVAEVKAASGQNLSRNEWINRVVKWTLHSLPVMCEPGPAHLAALHAPLDVKGTERHDMGLNHPEGIAPK